MAGADHRIGRDDVVDPARAHRVSALATRLGAVLRLVEERGLTSGQIATRGAVLRELDRAVRRAVVAAHHAIFEPLRNQ